MYPDYAEALRIAICKLFACKEYGRVTVGKSAVLTCNHIQLWVDAHANLPPRARWIAKADVVPGGTTKRVALTLHLLEVFLPESIIDALTVQAYRETEYRVYGDEPFTLQVGLLSEPLSRLYQCYRVDCSAFITSCNPFSRLVDDADNVARHAALGEELSRRSLASVEGFGQHPSNQWPGERSYLILGVSLEAARKLGATLEQNAILWTGADATPQLILLR